MLNGKKKKKIGHEYWEALSEVILFASKSFR